MLHANKDAIKRWKSRGESKPLYQYIIDLLIECGVPRENISIHFPHFIRCQLLERPTQEFPLDETPLIIMYVSDALIDMDASEVLMSQSLGLYMYTCDEDNTYVNFTE